MEGKGWVGCLFIGHSPFFGSIFFLCQDAVCEAAFTSSLAWKTPNTLSDFIVDIASSGVTSVCSTNNPTTRISTCSPLRCISSSSCWFISGRTQRHRQSARKSTSIWMVIRWQLDGESCDEEINCSRLLYRRTPAFHTCEATKKAARPIPRNSSTCPLLSSPRKACRGTVVARATGTRKVRIMRSQKG